MNDDQPLAANGPEGRDTRRTYLRSGGLAVLVAAAAIGLAACSSGSSSPQVASLGTSSSSGGNGDGSSTGSGNGNGSSATTGSSSTRLPKGNPTKLLDEWAACMRSHGDTNQADPTITANKLIDIVDWNLSTPGGIYGTNKGGQGNSGPGQFCRAYLTAAQTALQGGQSPKPPSQAELLKFSECMRANGIPDFPDPTAGGGIVMNVGAGGDLNPNNRTFQNSSKVCAKKTGVRGLPGSGPPPPGTIEIDGGLPGGANG